MPQISQEPIVDYSFFTEEGDHHNVNRSWRFHNSDTDREIIPRYAGVEMELNGVEDFSILPRVKQKILDYGGSVVKDWYNAEILLPPARGTAFITMVHEVFDELKKAKPWFATGPTIFSGYHLHVDGRELKYRHLGHTMIMYSKYEPMILQTQPYQRFLGKYCKPNGPSLGEGWEKAAQGPAAQEMIFKSKAQQPTPHGSQNRYRSVNFAAWYKYQTIEIRCHEGTTEADDIIQWASLWTNFVDRTKNIPYKSANKHVPDLSSVEELVGDIGAEYMRARTKKYAAQWSATRLKTLIPTPADMLGTCSLYKTQSGGVQTCLHTPVFVCNCITCGGQRSWCVMHLGVLNHPQWQ